MPAPARTNRFLAGCVDCGHEVPANTGILSGSKSAGWTVRHAPARLVWDSGNGHYVGGCDEAREKLPVFVKKASKPRGSSKYAYTGSGARMTERSQRCEDAPCCGCCD